MRTNLNTLSHFLRDDMRRSFKKYRSTGLIKKIPRFYDKRLTFRLSKELPQYKNNKTNNPTEKWAKNLKRHFSKEHTQTDQQAYEKMLNITNY